MFKNGLEKFSRKYQRQISQNPSLRAHFTKMCSKIGVDPLVCKPIDYFFLFKALTKTILFLAAKGFWTEILGIGDFYYELAVQIVEICFSMRVETGGFLEINVLISKLKKMRNRAEKDDNNSDITEYHMLLLLRHHNPNLISLFQ